MADLNVNSTRSWKEEFIRQTFSEMDVNRILKIPLGNAHHKDFMIWKGEAIGSSLLGVSTRLCYTTLWHLQIQPTRWHKQIFTKKLWGMNLHPKVKHTF